MFRHLNRTVAADGRSYFHFKFPTLVPLMGQRFIFRPYRITLSGYGHVVCPINVKNKRVQIQAYF